MKSSPVIYHESLSPILHEFGVPFEVDPNRSKDVFLKLKKKYFLKETDSVTLTKISKADVLRVHEKKFVERFFSEGIKEEFLKTFEVSSVPKKFDGSLYRENVLFQLAGTFQCFKYALESGFCYFLGGGMHHAMSDGGRGFCPLNDIVIAIKKLQVEKKLNRVIVLDVDAHKGDGTAELVQDNATIDCLSIHMKGGWPLLKHISDKRVLIPSDWDIPIGESDQYTYLERLETQLKLVFSRNKYELAVIVHGADPYEGDSLDSAKKLSLPMDVMLKRDELVSELCKRSEVPQAYVMAGGYGKKVKEVYFHGVSLLLDKFHPELRIG